MINRIWRLARIYGANIEKLPGWQSAVTAFLPFLFGGTFIVASPLHLPIALVLWLRGESPQERLLAVPQSLILGGILVGLSVILFKAFVGDKNADPSGLRPDAQPPLPPAEPKEDEELRRRHIGRDISVLAWRTKLVPKSVLKLDSPASGVAASILFLLSLRPLLHLSPIGFLLLIAAAVAARYTLVWGEIEVMPPRMPAGPEGHKLALKLLSLSWVPLERAHVLVGWLAGTSRSIVVLLHDQLAKMHILINGGSGTFKTFKAAVPLFLQLVASGRNSGVYIDLKGGVTDSGNALFWMLKRAAGLRGIPFYFFSINPEEASHLMNLLQDPGFLRLSDNQRAQIVAQAFGLEHGEGFGPGYFGSVAEMLLKRAFAIFRAFGRGLSWRSLLAFLSSRTARKDLGMSRRDFDNASHPVFVMDKLSEDGRLNMVGMEAINPKLFKHAITMDKIISGPVIIYLKLTSQLEPTTSRCVARLFVRVLIAALVNWRGPRVDHIYVALDECQEMLSRGILTPLRQARSLKLSFLFIFQTLADLKREDMDYTDQILGNTSVKLMASVRDEKGREYLATSGGERIRELTGTSRTVTRSAAGESEGEGEQTRELLVPVFDTQEVNRVNADTELAVFEANPMSGYTRFDRPQVIELDFPISPEEFCELDSPAWPEPDGIRTVRSSDLPPPASPAPQPAPAAPPAPVAAHASQPTRPRSAGERRQRRQRTRTPEEVERSEKVAEALRSLAKKRLNDEFSPGPPSPRD